MLFLITYYAPVFDIYLVLKFKYKAVSNITRYS